MQVCGESNATIFREAAAAGVARAAFISVADYRLPGKSILSTPQLDYWLKLPSRFTDPTVPKL